MAQPSLRMLLLFAFLGNCVYSTDAVRHDGAGTEVAQQMNNTGSQALAELMPSREATFSEAFYIALYLGSCKGGSSTAPSSMKKYSPADVKKIIHQSKVAVPFLYTMDRYHLMQISLLACHV